MEQVLRWYQTAAKLKQLKRAGWERCGVKSAESVAEHGLGVALLAMAVAGKMNLNVERCAALAVVHDLAESLAGDITPHDAITPEQKHRVEAKAMERLEAALGDDRISKLWREFEEGASDEAKLVRDLDVIEMAWQAKKYQQRGELSATDAAGFMGSASQRVTSDAGRRLLRLVMAM